MAYGGTLNHLTNLNYGAAKPNNKKLNQLTYLIDETFSFKAYSSNYSEGAYRADQAAISVPYGQIGVYTLNERRLRTGTVSYFNTLDEIVNFLKKKQSSNSGVFYSVFFGDGCTIDTIPDYQFANCHNLYEIRLPKTIGGSSIGKGAFRNCDGLMFMSMDCAINVIPEEFLMGSDNIQIIEFGGNTVTTIGKNAFRNCTRLEKINFGNNLTTIGEGAFYDCDKLSSIDLSSQIKEIGPRAFYDCDKLKTINLGRITVLSDQAFEDCDSLTNIVLVDTISTVGERCFANCKNLRNVFMSDNIALTELGKEMFLNCTNLRSINIANGITSIGEGAFEGSGLADITLGGSVKYLGKNAFKNCSVLYSVDLSNTSIHRMSEGVFQDDRSLKVLKFPKTLENIDDYALSGTAIQYIVFPYGTSSLGKYSVANMPYLEEVNLPETLSTIDRTTFSNDPRLKLIKATSSILKQFNKSDDMTIVNIDKGYPSNAITIEDIDTGEQTTYQSFDTVKTALLEDFAEDSHLKLVLGGDFLTTNNVNTIKGSLFFDVTSIVSVGDTTTEEVTQNEDADRRLKIVSIVIGDGPTQIANGTFYNCQNLKNVTLPTTLISIGSGAFSNCQQLTSVNFAELSVLTGIYSAAFSSTRLYDITIPDTVTTYGATGGNFHNVRNLHSLKLSANVRIIPNGFFNLLQEIDSAEDTIKVLNIPANVESLGNAAFMYRNSIKIVNFGSPDEPTKFNINVNGPDSGGALGYIKDLTINFYGKSKGDYTNAQLAKLLATSVDQLENTMTSQNITINYIPIFSAKMINILNAATNGIIASYGTYDAVQTKLGTLDETVRVKIVIGDNFAAQNSSNKTVPSAWCNANTNITSVVIGEGVTTIESGAFSSCSNLTNVTFPDSVTSIGSSAFASTGLRSVIVPENLRTVDTSVSGVFAGCANLTSVTFPTQVSFGRVGPSMFASTALKDIVIPGNVKTIDNGAFAGISTIESITLNEGLEELSTNAFAAVDEDSASPITEVEIPSTVTTIASNAFDNQVNITHITIHKEEDSISGAPWGATNATVTWVTD